MANIAEYITRGIFGPPFERGEEQMFEALRLNSFTNWPLMSPTPTRLAAAGFSFTGDADEVVCFACSIKISNWTPAQLGPMDEHQLRSPDCTFLSGTSTNVPMSKNTRVSMDLEDLLQFKATNITARLRDDGSGIMDVLHVTSQNGIQMGEWIAYKRVPENDVNIVPTTRTCSHSL